MPGAGPARRSSRIAAQSRHSHEAAVTSALENLDILCRIISSTEAREDVARATCVSKSWRVAAERLRPLSLTIPVRREQEIGWDCQPLMKQLKACQQLNPSQKLQCCSLSLAVEDTRDYDQRLYYQALSSALGTASMSDSC